MAYNAIAQREHEQLSDDESSVTSTRPDRAVTHDTGHESTNDKEDATAEPRPESRESFASAEEDHFSERPKSPASKPEKYDLLEEDDYEEPIPVEPGNENASHKEHVESKGSDGDHSSSQESIRRGKQHEPTPTADTEEKLSSMDSSTSSPEPTMTVRTYSSEGSMSRQHPKPGLQSIQGAYIDNVERLERSAERLSMGSDIGEELRKLKEEERKSASRRSSLHDSQANGGRSKTPSFSHQFSTGSISSSIVGVNSHARHGGYSSSAYVTSPKGSIRSGSSSHFSYAGRPTSHGSRLANLPEPELEGRPLDSMVTSPGLQSTRSTTSIRSPSSAARHAADDDPHEHTSPSSQKGHVTRHDQNATLDTPERPASTDTYQQARTLFTDFDGVHYPVEPQSRSTSGYLTATSREPSFNRNSRPMSFLEPLPGENMIYYPAPVPEILNLPKRLSKIPAGFARDKRRSQAPGFDRDASRQSVNWFPGLLEGVDHSEEKVEKKDESNEEKGNRRNTVNLDRIPPQLRASVFFQEPSVEPDIVIKGGSAVATLDSILDASATAPVNAFLDHPFAGQVGKEVYGKERASQSSADLVGRHLDVPKSRQSNVLRKRNSAGTLEIAQRREGSRFSLASSDARLSEALHGAPSEAELAAQHDDTTLLGRSGTAGPAFEDEGAINATEEPDEGQLEDEFFGPPTTLLAELQLRKRQQRQRNLTAATAFPNGMRSTLLELDAVAQLQKNSRQHKRVTLAWERPDAAQGDEIDDEVPLGVLFPGKDTLMNKYNTMSGADRPLGLMAKRDLEDNEPLSRRRERLRRPSRPFRDASPNARASTMFLSNLDTNGRSGDVDLEEPEGETLAQRLKRMKTKSQLINDSDSKPINNDTAGGDFTSELLGELGIAEAKSGKDEQADVAKQEPEAVEETLGQRKKRLQAEREAQSHDVGGENEANSRPRLQATRSMADILQAYPVPIKRSSSQDRLSTMLGAPNARGGRSVSQDRLSTMLGAGQRSSSQDRLSTMLGVTQGQRSASHEQKTRGRAARRSMYPQFPNTPGVAPAPGFNQYGMAANPYGANAYNGGYMMQNYSAPMSQYQLGSPNAFFSPTLGTNMGVPYTNGSYFPAPMQQPMNMNQSMMFQPNMFNQGMPYGGMGGGFGGNASMMQLPQVPSMQRDRIDQWRQSVTH
ncbi:hypothetical protein L228DRAFT_243545 [Xylona heveae TC161]|uniref:Uncharacterized protein n=1 Tax=Xylona heveae (strain CBS 132557 / TC161) TaxID=1328760 RepID=A0A165IFC3_XYLHT|nr:hypothetical protein L228DRAFT_243545 [Xylona heveae TC161]KZF24820.1 hypothetical protein L228DRAFT_243545 [Xylona heveae TC161]